MGLTETIGLILQVIVGLVFLAAGVSVFWNWLLHPKKKRAAIAMKLLYLVASIVFAVIGAWLAYTAALALLTPAA